MRYGLQFDILRSFSWQHRVNSFRACAHGLVSQMSLIRIYLYDNPTHLHQYPISGLSTFLRPSIAPNHKYRNINLFSISYGFRPCFRFRLTLGRLPLPRKPWVFSEYVFHTFYRYSCQHNHFFAVHLPSRKNFDPQRTLPYPMSCDIVKASVTYLAPLHFRRRVIRPVSYYAFFKRWLLLSQRPGCLYDSTTFPTEYVFRDLSC